LKGRGERRPKAKKKRKARCRKKTYGLKNLSQAERGKGEKRRKKAEGSRAWGGEKAPGRGWSIRNRKRDTRCDRTAGINSKKTFPREKKNRNSQIQGGGGNIQVRRDKEILAREKEKVKGGGDLTRGGKGV